MERSLLHRPHQGDEAALSAVIDRYAGYVSAILSRILGADTPQADIEELARFPREAVLSMGETEREIFLRYYYAYEPIAEIAEALGIPLSTVKIRLRRGRQKLKEILQKGGYACEDQDL